MDINQKIKMEIQLVIFKIGDEEFGVEINQVREIVKLVSITKMPKAPDFVSGVVNLRGQILPVIDLAKRLSLPGNVRNEMSRIMVVEFDSTIAGMIVDEVTEVVRIKDTDIDKDEKLLGGGVHQAYLKGVGKIGDRLLILIDLTQVLEFNELDHISRLKKEEI